MPVNSFDNYPMNWKPDLSKTAGPKYKALVKAFGGRYKNGTFKGRNKASTPQRRIGRFFRC